MFQHKLFSVIAALTLAGCQLEPKDNLPVNSPSAVSVSAESGSVDPFWKNATVYFMLTDRFNNGDPQNDTSLERKRDGALLRDFMGGDLKGITHKIEDGYFDKLGVNAIWMTPVTEQIHGFTDDEWGKSYAYHGYWPKDWTRVDPNFGTEADFRELVETAHQHGIRILMDVIINHTGPITATDSQWPSEWVRTAPTCQWKSFAQNVSCTLNDNLPDIRTESDEAVELPPFLLSKWQEEGRLDQELHELDAFFSRTGYPRAPRYYILKWLTDWVRDYGIDGFRADTAKHVEAKIWQELKQESQLALREWKQRHPDRKLDDRDFFMVGEVMNFGVDGFKNTVKGGRAYDYGDQQVDFFANGFDSLINMGFPTHVTDPMEQLFSKYSASLNGGELDPYGVMNYIVSHDDPEPFDQGRERTMEAATKLMLAPGTVQIYYGDELARPLLIEGTIGDATLRSYMNWGELNEPATQKLLTHWRKLGHFRSEHLAVGAGIHRQLQETPYIFKRTLDIDGHSDQVLVATNIEQGKGSLSIFGVFPEGTVVKDYYSGQTTTVKDGKVDLRTPYQIVLLGEPAR